MFYLSNVEDYLGRPDAPRSGTWQNFCHNAATLPVDRGSVFLSGRSASPLSAPAAASWCSAIWRSARLSEIGPT